MATPGIGAETDQRVADRASRDVAGRSWGSRLSLENLVMGAAVLAVVVLIVLPLLSLLAGSVLSDAGLSLTHFQEVFSSRLYTRR